MAFAAEGFDMITSGNDRHVTSQLLRLWRREMLAKLSSPIPIIPSVLLRKSLVDCNDTLSQNVEPSRVEGSRPVHHHYLHERNAKLPSPPVRMFLKLPLYLAHPA